MVRIIELFEAELVLPKVLKPGQMSDIDAVNQPNTDTVKSLEQLKSYQDTATMLTSKMKSDYIWTVSTGRKAKTPEYKAAEMEKFKSALEAINSESVQFIREIKNAMPFIERNCSKYLPSMHNSGLLYRGFTTRDLSHSVFYGYPRADRIPKDSIPQLQIAFDKALEEIGVEALRRNSLFCTGSKNFAQEYGLTFIIIPCNDAKFAWSKKHQDIILDQFWDPKFIHLQNTFDNKQLGLTKYLEEFQHMFYRDNRDLSEAIKSGHEIWFTGHYVAILASLESQLRKMLFG